ncbi:DUF481 domain-containing protein [Emticicia sp. C21]|uniref:DUF481 domain-containing protein n=1 Tax=Emticicia sp. C21 TaxID=2302915 RepID=UPI000E3537CC|nr:DUF481 domain-containing protein [Emticicia sp. C21]RFS15873.1 DUF481 domain-containing protein [Emticicia sp. C21]
MKPHFIIFIFPLFSVAVKAQTPKSDTLRPQNLPPIQTPPDSTNAKQENKGKPQDSTIVKFKSRLSADGTYTSGNVDRALIQLASGLDWNISKILNLSSSQSFTYGQQNKLLSEREFFIDARGTILPEKTLYSLGFTSYEKSNLRLIHNRFIWAAGLGLKLIQKKNAYLSVTNVVLYEWTDFIVNNEFPDKDLWRNSTRIQGEYTVDGGKLFISHMLLFQPGFTQKNLRWNGNLTFRYQITKRTGIRSTIENSYESVVVEGRKNNDFRLTFGVEFENKFIFDFTDTFKKYITF